MITNLDMNKIVYPCLLPQPTMIADNQSPRKLDSNPWLDYNPSPYLGSE